MGIMYDKLLRMRTIKGKVNSEVAISSCNHENVNPSDLNSLSPHFYGTGLEVRKNVFRVYNKIRRAKILNSLMCHV